MERWDVIVVGAGPAGAIAALHLADGGAKVLLIDRRTFPREKTCGDALLPDAVRCLRRAGVWESLRSRVHVCERASFVSPSGTEVAIDGEFVTIRRAVLDDALVKAASRAGAVVRHGHVTGVLPVEGRGVTVEIDRSRSHIVADVLVVATGADVSLLEPLGMVRRAEPSAVAVRTYLGSSASVDRLVFSFQEATLPGYGWIFPLGDGTYNVGVGLFGGRHQSAINPRHLFDRFVEGFPMARELFAVGEATGPLRGARLRCGLAGVEPLKGSVLAVGEAVGTTFPFSGEGIGKAMESAELAAISIASYLEGSESLSGYGPRLEGLRPRYRGYEIAERWLQYRWLADFMAWRAARSPSLRRVISEIVTEAKDPTAVFSVAGVLRSVWG